MVDPLPTRRRSARFGTKFWVWTTIAAGATVTLVLLVVASSIPFKSETLRRKLVATLAERLDSEVALTDLKLRLLPRFHAEGAGLTIRHRGRTDVPPLIAVQKLSVDATLLGIFRKHVTEVRLEGLEINIPPDRNRPPSPTANRDQPVANPARPPADSNGRDPQRDDSAGAMPPQVNPKDIVVDNLIATDARLVIIPSEPKPPKVWAIHQLHMKTVSFDGAMPFEAALTNAVPPGEIATQGSFGPWQAGDPGETPLSGTFTFAHADLSIFKGISGILSAHGEFGGTLGRLGIHGETDTPDFTVAVGGHPIPLHTDYHATVDGTNGDTLLDRIDASFLHTAVVAKGSVVDTPGKSGRTVTLDVVMDRARIEDVLKLAVKTPKSPMVGALKLSTKFVLPPGERDVVDKLRLNGRFSIASVQFTNLDIQSKINELSHRSRGQSPDDKRQRVVSNFTGQFRLADGTLTLPTVSFEVPGAGVRLAGRYGLRPPEKLDFKGMLLLDAKISDTQTGIKRILLKAIDPLFKKEGGGTAIPIKIQGTRNEPAFGIDAKGLLHRRQ